MSALPSSAIVIGDGIVGLACAVELQRRGVATTLVGPSAHPTGASIGNAGHIAIEQVEPLASRAMVKSLPSRLFLRGGPVSLPLRDIGAWLPFALRLLRAASPDRFARGTDVLGTMLSTAFPAWRRLADTAGAADLLRQDGHYVLWESDATAVAGRERWSLAKIGETRFRNAGPAELAQLQSLMRVPIAGAIRFEGSGQVVDLDALVRALRACFQSLGGVFRQGRAASLIPGGAGMVVNLEDGGSLDAPTILVAAGVSSASLLAPLKLHAPIIAERGYHIQSPAPDWPADLPPVVFEDRSMIVTRFATSVRAAGFVEFGRASSSPDPRKWQRLRDHVAALGLPFPGPVQQWMGARPTLPDYLPAIGRSARYPQLAYAFGHQHLGLTLAATTAERVAQLLLGETIDLDLQSLSLDRFA